jgi:hypothetical protein
MSKLVNIGIVFPVKVKIVILTIFEWSEEVPYNEFLIFNNKGCYLIEILFYLTLQIYPVNLQRTC